MTSSCQSRYLESWARFGQTVPVSCRMEGTLHGGCAAACLEPSNSRLWRHVGFNDRWFPSFRFLCGLTSPPSPDRSSSKKACNIRNGSRRDASSTPGDFSDTAENVQDENHILRAVGSRQVPGPARMSSCVVSVSVDPVMVQSQLHCAASIMIACVHA